MPAIPIIALVVAAAGTAVSAYAANQQAQAAADAQEAAGESALAQAKYNANVANYNAQTAEENAAEVRKKAAYDARLQREKIAKTIGQQRLDYASAGVELSSGSPLETMLQQARDGELDAQTLLYNGEVDASVYDKKSTLLKYQAENSLRTGYATAEAYGVSAGATSTAGTINAGATILSGSGKALSSYSGNYTTGSSGL